MINQISFDLESDVPEVRRTAVRALIHENSIRTEQKRKLLDRVLAIESDPIVIEAARGFLAGKGKATGSSSGKSAAGPDKAAVETHSKLPVVRYGVSRDARDIRMFDPYENDPEEYDLPRMYTAPRPAVKPVEAESAIDQPGPGETEEVYEINETFDENEALAIQKLENREQAIPKSVIAAWQNRKQEKSGRTAKNSLLSLVQKKYFTR